MWKEINRLAYWSGCKWIICKNRLILSAFLSCISLTLWRLHSNLPCSNYSILIIIYNKQLSLTYFSYQVLISLCIYTLVLLYTISPFPCTKLSWCLTYCTVLLVLACQLWFVYFLHFALCELMYGCIRHCPLVPTDPSPSFHHGWRNSSVFLLLLLWEKWENITWFSAQARWAASSIYCLWITILTAFVMIFWSFVMVAVIIETSLLIGNTPRGLFQSSSMLSCVIYFQMHHRRRRWVTWQYLHAPLNA